MKSSIISDKMRNLSETKELKDKTHSKEKRKGFFN